MSTGPTPRNDLLTHRRLYKLTERLLGELDLLYDDRGAPAMVGLAYFAGVPPRLSEDEFETRQDYKREAKRSTRQMEEFSRLFAVAWRAGLRDDALCKTLHVNLRWRVQKQEWGYSGTTIMRRTAALQVLKSAMQLKGLI